LTELLDWAAKRNVEAILLVPISGILRLARRLCSSANMYTGQTQRLDEIAPTTKPAGPGQGRWQAVEKRFPNMKMHTIVLPSEREAFINSP